MSSLFLHFLPFRLDPSNERLWDETQEIPLRPKTFAVLRYLVEHAEQLVTKDELMSAVWPDTVVGDDALTGCIRDLRKVLGDEAKKPRYIETVHRRGYRFLPPVTTQPVASSKLEVVSQEERVSSQLSSLDEAPRNPGEEVGQAEGCRAAPVFPSGLQPAAYSLSQDSAPGTQDLPSPALRRSLFNPRFLWLAGVLLVAGTLGAVWYLSLPIPRTQPLPSTQELPLPDKPSIAVMPFTNMSGDPEQEYFSDGLTDDLITDLSCLSQLFVIARYSVFTYKGKAVKVQEVSKELGVRYVLEGSVQKAAEQVRVNAQLVDATTGRHVWAERYDRPFKDIFALQDEIIQKIVTTLKLQVTLHEQGRLVRKTTDNVEAYDYYLRGAESYFRYTKEANAQARQLWEKALALDPRYAEAYAWLGITYFMEWSWRWSQDPQALERALALAQRALALDGSLPVVHWLLGRVYAGKQQYDQAIVESERAIALDPNLADNYGMQAELLNAAGRPAEALRAAEQALHLNPHYPGYLLQLGSAYRWTGRYADAIAVFKQLLVRNPNFLAAYSVLASSYLGQWASQLEQDPQTLERALAAAQRAVALNDSYPWGHGFLGVVYVAQKQYEPAIAEMERAVALDPNDAGVNAVLAEILSRAGKAKEAVRMVEQALRLKASVPGAHLASVGIAYALAGQYKETIAPVKQFLARYPNHLGPHLILAAVYSEVGKEAEARAEAAEVLRLNPKFSLEVHKERAPIKDPATLERHIAALRKAGLK
jgi:TolB-like protein/DNA-binding winged helix-turn-helix (wHTH) protein/cytochrome c-type biogenesis protein CcmH/NrfG